VDGRGLADSSKMNDEDFKIVESWIKDGYVKFSRLPAKWLMAQKKHSLGGVQPHHGVPHQVRLSDEAWADAHQLRKERSARMTSEENLRQQFGAYYEQAMEMLNRAG